LLDKRFFSAANACLNTYGEYIFRTAKEDGKGGNSKVDYVGLVDDERSVLAEAKSPSVMKIVGGMLPARGIELKWVRNQSLVPNILQEVSTRVLSCNTKFKETCNCIDRFISGSEKDGMAVPCVPQLLDRLSSETMITLFSLTRQNAVSKTPRNPFGHFLVPFCLF